MKISKISAGFGVALLASIGAVTAAKTHTATTVYYQTGNTANPCTATSTDQVCIPGGTSCKGTSGSSLNKTYYRSISSSAPAGVCETALTHA